MKNERSRASSTSRCARAADRSWPVGFWQPGWTATSLTSWRARMRSSASTSMPFSSTGTPITRAPVTCSELRMPMNVGDSQTTTSPGATTPRQTRSMRLPRARGDHDLLGGLREAEPAAALGDLLAQFVEAVGVEVAERVAPDLVEHLAGDPAERAAGIDRGVGRARGQRDDVGVRRDEVRRRRTSRASTRAAAPAGRRSASRWGRGRGAGGTARTNVPRPTLAVT